MKFEVRDNIQFHVWQDLEKKLNWIFAPRQMPQYVVECAENFHEATDVSRTLAARKSSAERCDVFWKWTLKKHSERCTRTRLFLANGKAKQFCFRQFSPRNYFDDMNRVWYYQLPGGLLGFLGGIVLRVRRGKAKQRSIEISYALTGKLLGFIWLENM